MRQWVPPVGIALLLLAAEPLVGWLPVALAFAVLVVALALSGHAPRPRVVLAVIGGMIGALSAVEALARHDWSEPRWMLGVVALVCAVIASAGAVAEASRRALARLTIVGAAVIGAVAINLLDINTFYVLAATAWVIAAALPPSTR